MTKPAGGQSVGKSAGPNEGDGSRTAQKTTGESASGIQRGGGVAGRVEQRGKILSRFSHDLRAPLNAIISFSQILVDGLVGDLNDEQTQQVEIIQKSGYNLLHVIGNVITMARMDAGLFLPHITRFDLGELADKLVDTLHGAGQGEEANLQVRIAEGSPTSIDSDEEKLLLVMNNMARYALFSSNNGDVTLELGKADTDAFPLILGGSPGTVGQSRQGFLKITVRHDVIQREGHRLADLFQDLDEIDLTDDERIRGVHLGLSLARKTVESLGGRVWVEKTGEGGLLSTAIVPLQAAVTQETSVPADEADGGEPEIEAEAPARGTVLVVEDNPFNRNFVKIVLDHMGYRVVEAENGEIGVQKAAEIHPDLILMDMMMPVMDGFEATRRIKSNAETEHIPILAITALTLEKDRRRAKEAGCDDFMPMPAPRVVLEEIIDKWVSSTKTD